MEYKYYVLITACLSCGVSCQKYKVGLMIHEGCCYTSSAMETTASAINIALDDLKSNRILQDSVNISIIWRNVTSPSQAAGAAVVFIRDENVDVIFGSASTTATLPSCHLTSYLNFPQISWSATSPELTDKTIFTTFVRSLGPFSKVGNVFNELFMKFGWKITGLMNYNSKLCKYSGDGIKNAFRKTNITITQSIEWEWNASNDELKKWLSLLKLSARIIIIICPGASDGDLRRLMLQAWKLGMCNGDYVFIRPTLDADDDIETLRLWEAGDADDDNAKEAFKQLLYVTIATWSSDEQKEKVRVFRQQIPRRMLELPWKNSYALDNGYIGSKQSLYLYDVMYLYGIWLNHTLESGGTVDHRDGRALLEFTANVTFSGASGPVIFDTNGDREPFYWVWDFVTDGLPRIAVIINTLAQSGHHQIIEEWKGFEWQTRDGKPPPDKPVCGFYNELCPPVDENSTTLAIAVSVAVFTVLLCVIAVVYFIKKRQTEKEMMKMLWKIDIAEVDFKKFKSSNSRSFLSLVSIGMTSQRSMEAPVVTSSGYFVGMFRGQAVSLRYLSGVCKVLTKTELHILKDMREMTHENINPFIGASLAPKLCIVYMFCAKGSLQELLENDEIKLDSMFKHSLAFDLVKGMLFLHNSRLKSHGRLKSTNCLVDSRWVLKVSDFGLHLFSDNTDPIDLEEQQRYTGLLWTAPELLRGNRQTPGGTQPGDVYSFAIILHEIFFRLGVFPVTNMSTKDIVGRVRNSESIPCRPEMPKNHETQEPTLLQLLDLCWREDPKERPTFAAIRDFIRTRFKHKYTNIMDVMLNKLEKYASNLEELVEQRTNELVEEKKKTDMLLCRMLPPIIAEKLKTGELVPPETFEAVTVFFSDIVGFTTLAALSSPLQVVDLLNELYSVFDGIISEHDAYKVETIGDAYLVVSGLPKRNGDLHAGVIADMSLDFLSTLLDFRISHLPDRPLMLRIGLHTGPCCAGVVGRSMPRYCVFGDTVNTASRMESNGKPQRIHITEATHQALHQLGGYVTSYRDKMPIKGKGSMPTYWLNGKQGFTKRLPEIQLD